MSAEGLGRRAGLSDAEIDYAIAHLSNGGLVNLLDGRVGQLVRDPDGSTAAGVRLQGDLALCFSPAGGEATADGSTVA